MTSLKIEDGETVLAFSSSSYSDSNLSGCPVKKLYLGRNISYPEYYSPFYNNRNLTTLIVGNNVTSISRYAFSGCSGLTSVTIGNSVKSIGNWSFSGCSGLTSVTIPASVTSIDDSAFWGCRLTSIHCFGTTPPDVYDPFSYDTYQTATLYVPSGSYSAYKNADYWKGFNNIVEE